MKNKIIWENIALLVVAITIAALAVFLLFREQIGWYLIGKFGESFR